MKKFDITLKDALAGLEKAFCKVFLNLDIIEAKPLNTEFKKIEEKQADYIVKIKDINNKESILHIEFQTTNHKEMHIRMLRYLTELYRVYKMPIIQVVLYLGEEKLTMKDGISFEALKTKIEYKYQLISSKELDCELFLNSNDSDMVVLSILCNLEDVDKKKFIKKVFQRLYELNRDDENSYKNFILKLEVVSELRKNLKPLIKEQAMVADKIKVENLPSYEIGYKKGIEEGNKKLLEEKRAIAYSLLKFHDDKTIAKIVGLPIEEVRELRNSYISP